MNQAFGFQAAAENTRRTAETLDDGHFFVQAGRPRIR
jgi:hypothetical protein